jgi:hypothetical protein
MRGRRKLRSENDDEAPKARQTMALPIKTDNLTALDNYRLVFAIVAPSSKP